MRNMSGAAQWWNPSVNSRARASDVAGRLRFFLKNDKGAVGQLCALADLGQTESELQGQKLKSIRDRGEPVTYSFDIR
jgi:hypothetical protein